MSAASLYQGLEPKSIYYDKHSKLTPDEYKERLRVATTLYVGNLSFYTQESQLLEFFSQCGEVKNLIMGLNKQQRQPCGFCFVMYGTREEAGLAIDCLNLSMIDGRQVRIDWDYGFKQGRQFGRGKSTGGQVRDEVRQEFVDKDRPMQRPQRDNRNRYQGGGSYRGKRQRSEVEEEDSKYNDQDDNYHRRKRPRRYEEDSKSKDEDQEMKD